MGMSGQLVAPDVATFERLARAAFRRLPRAFRDQLGDVVIRVEEFADEEQLASVGIEEPFDLTGLYTGVPMGDKSAFDTVQQPDMIHLFRQPLLAEWCESESGVGLEALIHHVVVHEVGHHFGLSDDDMHALEDAAG